MPFVMCRRFNWLENIHDWCISRQLWWGHRIPVWYPQGRHAGSDAFFVARSEEEAYKQVQYPEVPP
jgi:valyl-tRNA synthetase